MTRETKIGLLIGLGFIVVFAVVLSHTGPVRPAGDDLDLAMANKRVDAPAPLKERPDLGPGPMAALPAVAGADKRTGLTDPRSSGAGLEVSPAHGDGLGQLPRPEAFDPKPDSDTVAANSPGKSATETLATGIAEIIHHVAPPLTDPVGAPEPTEKLKSPDESHDPAPEAGPEPVAPPVAVTSTREYVVQKGESLGKIAAKFYDSSSSAVVDFLVQSNPKQIKNKDFVVEGQKLVIPSLPPSLVEPANNFPGARLGSAVRLTRAEDLRKSGSSEPPILDRRAPKPASDLVVKNTDAGSPAAAGDGAGGESFRWYVIKPKDTLSSICKSELGSNGRLPEIRTLNKSVDPTKMKPGDKIKLPRSKPLSAATAPRHASA